MSGLHPVIRLVRLAAGLVMAGAAMFFFFLASRDNANPFIATVCGGVCSFASLGCFRRHVLEWTIIGGMITFVICVILVIVRVSLLRLVWE